VWFDTPSPSNPGAVAGSGTLFRGDHVRPTMRMELRVCKHCFEGTHENEHKQAVTRDLVACARVVREHREEIDLEEVHIRMVSEDESDDGRPAAIPAVGATLQDEQVLITDTQLITMGENGYMLVYPSPQDALKVLSGNVDEISKVAGEDIVPELSPESAEILSGYGPDPDEDGEGTQVFPE
jgi:hypothetical protein